MLHYVCKYTPIEVLKGFGIEVVPLDHMAEAFDRADQVASVNLCGFGRAVIEQVQAGNVKELVLVNCCDAMRRVYDIVKAYGNLDFVYLLDLPHENRECEVDGLSDGIERLKQAYGEYSGLTYDPQLFLAACEQEEVAKEPYVGIMGARVSPELADMIEESVGMKVENHTCLGCRQLPLSKEEIQAGDEAAEKAYARGLLGQIPCLHMNHTATRIPLFLDENLRGIVYHTIKFCDFYGFEYAAVKGKTDLPLLKIETDYTMQSMGQLKTRVEAFAETIHAKQGASLGSVEEAWSKEERQRMESGNYFWRGWTAAPPVRMLSL